jgi:hypothetical protein
VLGHGLKSRLDSQVGQSTGFAVLVTLGEVLNFEREKTRPALDLLPWTMHALLLLQCCLAHVYSYGVNKRASNSLGSP